MDLGLIADFTNRGEGKGGKGKEKEKNYAKNGVSMSMYMNDYRCKYKGEYFAR